MDLSAVLLSLGVVAAVIYYFLSRRLDYWDKKGIVGPKPNLFFGNVKDTTLRYTTQHELYEKYYNQFPKEKIVGLLRYWNPALLIRDLDVVSHVMIRDFDNFVDRGFSLTENGVGHNIFFMEGDTWRVLRSRLSPIFSTSKLKNMFHLIEERGDKFLVYIEPLLQKTPVQDAYKLLQKFTITTIASCAFGVDIDIHKIDATLTEIDNVIFHNHFSNEIEFAVPGFLKKINIDIFPAAITHYFNNIVRTIVRERKGVPSNRKDFMDLLLELKNANKIHGTKKHENKKDRSVYITDTVMAAQAFIFYSAGYETTASTLAYCLHELAHHQDIQDKLVREINDVLNQNGGKLSYDCLKQMTYLDRVISETLRMYPVVDPMTRRAVSSYKIPGSDVTIDKNTMVFASARGIHYDEQYYPDPYKFDPDRFTPENIKARHPCAYMPFGLGPRNCIGMRFAYVQARVCAVRLLARYRVRPSPGAARAFSYDPYRLVLASKHGIPLQIIPRN